MTVTDAINRRRFVSGAAALGSLAALPAAVAQAPTPITVAESEGHGWSVVFVAGAQDTWGRHGLRAEVAKFTAGRLAMEAVLAEKAQFATTTDSPTVLAAMRGLKPIIVADFSRSSREMLVVARNDRGVGDPKGLRGKRIATQVGTSGHYFLSSYLKLHGLGLREVTLVNMRGPEMVTALVKGDVDAFAWDWRTAQIAEQQAPGVTRVLPIDGIETIWQNHLILVTNEKTVREMPGVIERAVQALFAAEASMKADPARAVADVAARTATSKEATEVGIKLLDIEVNLSDRLVRDMVANAEWAIEAGLAQRPKEDLAKLFRSLVLDAPMRKIRPERVQGL
jgi:ABC-type nitrate/sulfonate/bicarbonate transport system substrate-binding protein